MTKNIIFIVSIILISCTSLFAKDFLQEPAFATAKSGKWTPEYGGGATPFRFICTSNMWRSQCSVGDITSNVSLCE